MGGRSEFQVIVHTPPTVCFRSASTLNQFSDPVLELLVGKNFANIALDVCPVTNIKIRAGRGEHTCSKLQGFLGNLLSVIIGSRSSRNFVRSNEGEIAGITSVMK